MFYRFKNENELLDWADYQYNSECLFTDLISEKEYNEHPNKIVINNYEINLNSDYDEEQTKQRQKDFESNFLTTPLGNYRLQPKGYANAQQSIDTVNALATMLGGLNETLCNMVIFYATPDFSKSEECTEEWLVQHQSHPQPMTLQDWATFYITFSTLYAQKMYKKDEDENNIPSDEVQE